MLAAPSASLQVWKVTSILCTTYSSLSVPSILYSLPSITHVPANSSVTAKNSVSPFETDKGGCNKITFQPNYCKNKVMDFCD